MTIDATTNATKTVNVGYNPNELGKGNINGFAQVREDGNKFPTMLMDYHFNTVDDVNKAIESLIKQGFKPENIKLNGQPVKDMFEKQQNAEKECTVNVKQGLTDRSLSGDVNGAKFDITHNGKLLKNDVITGKINGKDLNLEVKENVFSPNTIKGTIGSEPIDLQVKKNLGFITEISGNFKGKPISIKMKQNLFNYELKGNNIDIKMTPTSLLNSNVKISGKYNNDKDLMPILTDIVCSYQRKKEQEAALIYCCW